MARVVGHPEPELTGSAMKRINHNTLRNDSARVLREVAGGESFEVTNHGAVVAMLVPAVDSPLERLRVAGRVRLARPLPAPLQVTRPPATIRTSAEIIADARRDPS